MNNTASKQNKIKVLIEKIKSSKKYKLLVLLFSLILLSVILCTTIFSNKKQTVEIGNDYVTGLENKLSGVLSKIDGAGNVTVMITVESGMETVLASKINVTEADGKIIREETPIIVNGKTVTLKENYPKIIGVLIIAEGANNISVMTKIQQATLSVLDVDLNQVEILSMK